MIAAQPAAGRSSEDVEAPSIRLKRAPAPGRVRFEVSTLLGQPRAERKIASALSQLPGVRSVEARALTGNVLVLFDAARWTPDSLLEASGEALGVRPMTPGASQAAVPEVVAPPEVAVRSVVPSGRVRLTVPGLRRAPEREHPIEDRLQRIDGVQAARANAWTGNVLVLFDPIVCTVDTLVAACAEVSAVMDGRTLGAPGPQRKRSRLRPLAPPPRTVAVESEIETPPEPAVAWHAMDVPETVRRLDVDPERGLTSAEVETRLRRVGPNSMPQPSETSLIQLLSDQLVNAPTALLAAGAAISIATGGILEAGLIVVVLGVNAVVGAATERSGGRAIAALRQAVPIRARVRRDGEDRIVDADDLVPGDVVYLLPNDPVPADARIVEAQRLKVEESALTGESRPVDKVVAPVEERLPLADRLSMLHRGTTVIGGRGRALVVETGARTSIGALHILAAEAEVPPTPLERDLDQLGRWLAIGATSICGGVAALGLAYGAPLLYSMEVAVSLGVAAIPEGLTALATSVLALASRRMRQKGTLIRTLSAAEALGSVTVVCADKTGTLTENRMAAREMYAGGRHLHISGSALSPEGTFTGDGGLVVTGDDRILREALIVGVLCSDAELEVGPSGELVIDGSPTEGALQIAAAKAGLAPAELRAAHPRSDLRDRADGRRHMVTVHERDGQLEALLKGSPEEVLGLCDTVSLDGGVVPLDDETRTEIAAVNADMAGRAMRVLALARRSLPAGYDPDEMSRGLTFLGLIGLVDPIRPAVPGAIKALHAAGIRTVMITGDQALTATAVAQGFGLSRDGSLRVLEAGDLTVLGPDALHGLVRDVAVFARVPPEMKLEVVRALQANGNVVAMTGDGVNDGPALRAADVGVAMGERGTELARELL